MNRLSTYLLPTTAALALAAGGYIVWEHRKHAIRKRTVNPLSIGVVEAKFSKVAIPSEQAEETAAIKQEHEEVQAGEDTLLLQQYDWSAYTKVPPPVGALYEAMLLSSFLFNLGTTLNQEETSKILLANAGLRSILLDCWKMGCFDALRRHATVVTLVKDATCCQTTMTGDTAPGLDAGLERAQPKPDSVPAIKNGRDDAVTSQKGQHDSTDGFEDVLSSEQRSEGGQQEVIRDGTVIQQGNSESDATTTENSARVDISPTPFNIEAPAGLVHADTRGESPEAVSDRLKARETIEIHGGNFKNIAGDNWEIIYASDHHRKVAKWYSSTDYRTTHYDISKKRANNTGVWFIESGLFRKWQTDPNCRILWCPGIPGVGKTTIASFVIDHLRQFRSETVAVGFAYFNYKLQGQQSTTTVLECLCRQLYEVYQGEEASTSLEAFYEANQKDHPHPPAAGLHPALSSTCCHFQQYYIVLDALDEYLEICNIATLRELLRGLTTLGSSVKLLVTSRILGGMEELFREFGTIREDITARDEDMSTYIRNRIRTPGFCPGISDELSGEIVEKVKEAAGGRFLMAELHMNTLAGQLNPGFLKRVLAKLPHDIDVTYERVLQRFKTYPDSHRELAMMALAWVTRAKRRLSVKELQHALATEAGLENIDDYVTPISIITSLCAGLVIVRDESVIFVHFTAQDFFENSRIQSEYFPSAEESMLKTCLAYISLPLCTSTYQDCNWWEVRDTIPFYDYAAQNLGIHAQGKVEGASKDLDAFLSSNTTMFNQWCRHMQTPYYGVHNFPPDSIISAVFVAIYYDRVVPLQNLLNPLNDVPLMPEAETPLMYAARIGKTACLHAMLHWSQTQPDVATLGLLPDDQKIQSPLLVGAVNRRDGNGLTALMHACSTGQEKAVELLLKHEGIDVNLVDNNGRTPLNHAAERGREGVLRLLLRHKGINVNLADKGGWTPLIWAARMGHEGVVGLLLKHEGIDVNLADNDGRTPLSRATGGGHEGVVGLLLNHEGIDVNLAGDNGMTPLSHAAQMGHEGVVGLLLNHEGIDVNLVDNNGRTPLSYAATNVHQRVVGLLLNHEGIDVDLAGDNGMTPLSHAAQMGHGGVVGLLLNHEGIDVNLADNNGRTPLSYAATNVHEGVVGLFLNHENIDLNLADNEGWTPLIWAASRHREAVTKCLLRHPEIQLNRQDTKGATALTRTIIDWYGSLKYYVNAAKPVIQLLLSRDDLDINLPYNEGHTPLFYAQRAAEENRRWEEVCELLRAKGMVAVFDWLDVFHDSLFPQLFSSSTFLSDG